MNFKIPIINSVLPNQPQLNSNETPIENALTKKYSDDLRNNYEGLLKDFEHISKDLISMGYSPKLVINSFLAFKYKNIDEALDLIDKTSFTLWNHKFIESDNNFCFVCGDMEDNHKSVENILKRKNTENRIEQYNIDIDNIVKRNSFENLPKKIENFINLDDIGKNFNLINDDIFDKNFTRDNNENECPICLFNLEENKKFSLACNHVFCIDCICEYLKEEIRNSRVIEIKCPKKDCKLTFLEENISNFITEEFLYKYKKFLLREKYKNNENFVICPIVNCEGYANKNEGIDKLDNIIIKEENKESEKILIKEKDSNRNDLLDKQIINIQNDDEIKNNLSIENDKIDVKSLEKKKKLICNNKHEFCSQCNQAWHGDSSCEEDKEIKDFATYSGIIPKKCPKCKVWTEKNKGCNHMNCKICSYNWCWLCSKECLEDHFIQPGPCQGKQFDDGDQNIREADLMMARLMYNYRNNPLIYFGIFPLLIFFTFNNLIINLLSPQANQNRNPEQNAQNNQNNNNNDNNVNRDAFIVNNDLEMNIVVPYNNNRGRIEQMNCCQKICMKIILLFMIAIMVLVFSLMFIVFNMFFLFPISMLLSTFEHTGHFIFVKCFAIGTYIIFYLIFYPLGASFVILYFAMLSFYCIIKIIIT